MSDTDRSLVDEAVLAFTRDGDAAALADERVVAAGERLTERLSASITGAIDPDLLATVAWLEWCRHQAWGAQDALDRARLLFQILFPAKPALVPQELREELLSADLSRDTEAAIGQARAAGALAVAIPDPQILDRAVELSEALLSRRLRKLRGEQRRQVISALVAALGARFQVGHRLSDLDRAIELARQGAAGADGVWLLNLANALFLRYGATARQADLDEAIDIATLAKEQALDPGIGHQAERLLGMARDTRFRASGELDDLDDLALAWSAVGDSAHEEDATDRAEALAQVANTHRIRFQQTGTAGELLKAVETARQAVELLPAQRGPREAEVLSVLGIVLQIRFEQLGRRDDLDEAIRVAEEAVAGYPAGAPSGSSCLSNLSNAYRMRYMDSEEPGDLDAALSASRTAVGVTPDGHPNLPMYMNNLAIALQLRAYASGQVAELRESLEIAASGLERLNEGSLDEVTLLSTIANGFVIYAERAHAEGDFAEANAFGATITRRLTPARFARLKEQLAR
jgi:hypothetical protein